VGWGVRVGVSLQLGCSASAKRLIQGRRVLVAVLRSSRECSVLVESCSVLVLVSTETDAATIQSTKKIRFAEKEHDGRPRLVNVERDY